MPICAFLLGNIRAMAVAFIAQIGVSVTESLYLSAFSDIGPAGFEPAAS
jgi:hypothetical protein